MTVIVKNLNIRTRATDLAIINDVSFQVAPGKVLGIVGESGSGKTTVAHAMLGYSRAGTHIASGEVLIDGTDILAGNEATRATTRGRVVAYVPQDPSASLNPVLRLGEQLTERLVTGPDALATEDAFERVRNILHEVRLPSDDAFLRKYPKQISGGQQQRIGIAMAIASRPSLIVLDEPTTGLDVVTQREVLKLVANLCRAHQLSAIYVSHDLAVIQHVADDVLVLYAGRVVEKAAVGPFFQQPRHPYSAALLRSMPTLEESRRLQSIPGYPPALKERIGQCVFRDRCPRVQDQCNIEPALIGQAHAVRCYFPLDDVQRPTEVASESRHRQSDQSETLRVESLSAWYGEAVVLRDISLSLRRGKCLSIVGESGSGKSTLSRCLIGLHPSYSGIVQLAGETIENSARHRTLDMQRRLQYVFQNPYGSLNPRRSVGDTLRLSFDHYHRGMPRKERLAALRATLEQVKLPEAYLTRFPGELSGGEKQRVAIARALAANPEVILCDEITSALDVSVQAAIIELLRDLMAKGLSIIFVTHDMGVVRSISDEVAVLNQGNIVEAGETERVFNSPADGYTRQLMTNTLSVTPG